MGFEVAEELRVERVEHTKERSVLRGSQGVKLVRDEAGRMEIETRGYTVF